MEKSGKNITDAFFVVKKILDNVERFGTSLISILETHGYKYINYNKKPLTDASENHDLTTQFLWIFNRKNDNDDYVVMIDFNHILNDGTDILPVYSVRFKNRAKSWKDDDKWGQGVKGMAFAHLEMLRPFCFFSELNDNEKKENQSTNKNDHVKDVFIKINSLYNFTDESDIEIILKNFKEMQKDKKGFFI